MVSSKNQGNLIKIQWMMEKFPSETQANMKMLPAVTFEIPVNILVKFSGSSIPPYEVSAHD